MASTQNVDGPWHECVGLSGIDCKNLILNTADLDTENVKVVYPRTFNYYRIWIETDENGVVVAAPGRG